MRASALFNQMWVLPGASVSGVTVDEWGDLVVALRRRGRGHVCGCGRVISSGYDRSIRRWRHLDFGVARVWLEAEIWRVYCRDCARVRTEVIGWARPSARHTFEFEDAVGWLAQKMDKTALARLMRCSWETVNAIVARVVAEHMPDVRLDDLRHIGIDEISYLRGRRYLTVVVDHDRGKVVWVGEGRSRQTVEAFYQELGRDGAARLKAVTMDAAPAFKSVTVEFAPNAVICHDPFHVITWAPQALDLAFRSSDIPSLQKQLRVTRGIKPWRAMRYALRAGQEKLGREHRTILDLIRRERAELYEGYILKEELRDLYRIVAPEQARDYLTEWLARASVSRLPAFRLLADRIQRHFAGIVASVQLGLSNGRVEGMNTKIRVIQRRGYGQRSGAALAAMIMLCCSTIEVRLPTQT